MLVKLSGRALRPLGEVSPASFVGRVRQAGAGTAQDIFLAPPGETALPPGYRAYLLRSPAASAPSVPADTYILGQEFHYLGEGDVIRIDPQRQSVAALYRRNARTNAFLVTERCDNYCVMCSQPPKERDDSWIVDELNEVIPLVSQDATEIGITGGEPTLLGERLPALIARMKSYLPRTAVHVLSNGRGFKQAELARRVADVHHHDLMIGIPLYSDIPERHDFVVQARGAFEDTIRGILNLKTYGVRVELRFVIHRETYADLPAFARFVARNLLFVDHVALMGLEQMGFAKANIEAIWIDPLDYQAQLAEATDILARAGLKVSIYNHQLCVLEERLHRFACASISDWKNAYLDECARCAMRQECGGFFASSTVRRSRGIAARLAG